MSNDPKIRKRQGDRLNPIEHALAKRATINFRLSVADKLSMQATAKYLRLSLSEYLVTLHGYAKDKLKSKDERKTSAQEKDL
jgi:hypothetical protein